MKPDWVRISFCIFSLVALKDERCRGERFAFRQLGDRQKAGAPYFLFINQCAFNRTRRNR